MQITDSINIPDDEWAFSYARSGGPGGQNVNKVASKAILRWPLLSSLAISDAVRQKLIELYPSYITSDGVLLIVSQKYRDQDRNRQDCESKLAQMVRRAAAPVVPRKATKPTAASKRRRLNDKKYNAERKSTRRRPDTEN